MSTHPGRILYDKFMKPLSINHNQLAMSLGVNRSTIGRLINGRQRMSLEMAARLGAYFMVPPRWWLLMQAQFDAQIAESRPDLTEGVTRMEFNPDIILTPNGVLRLDEAEPNGAPPPPSITRDELSNRPSGSKSEERRVRVVQYESGSIALVGAES